MCQDGPEWDPRKFPLFSNPSVDRYESSGTIMQTCSECKKTERALIRFEWPHIFYNAIVYLLLLLCPFFLIYIFFLYYFSLPLYVLMPSLLYTHHCHFYNLCFDFVVWVAVNKKTITGLILKSHNSSSLHRNTLFSWMIFRCCLQLQEDIYFLNISPLQMHL